MRRRKSDGKSALRAAAATAIVAFATAPAALSGRFSASLQSPAHGVGLAPFYFGKLRDVNFGYPKSWRLATAPTSARVTHPARPRVFMQLTVKTGKAAVSPLEEARALLRQKQGLRGFTLIHLNWKATLQHGEIGAVSAEFTIGSGAAKAHRRAFFFRDHEGALVRVLFGAPHSGYPRWRPVFGRMIASISVDDDE